MMPSVLYFGPTRAGRKVAGNFTLFNPRYAAAYHPEGCLGPTRAGRKVAGNFTPI